MAETLSIKAESREKFGTRNCRRMRNAGQIPAVLSHKSDAPINMSVPDHEFTMALQKKARILELDRGDHKDKVFIREVQYDHLGERILHIDFTKVAKDEILHMDVALFLKGKPVGVVEEGGVLDQYIKELQIECLPDNIPERIEVDATGMKKDEPLHVKDIPAIDGVTFKQDGELVLACVTEHKVEETTVAESATPGPAEPEVIAKEKEDEEADEKKKK